MGFRAYHGEPGPGCEALGKVPRPTQPLVLSEVGSGGMRWGLGVQDGGLETEDPPQWRLRRPGLPMEQPLHRWEDRTQWLHSLKELRAGQRAGHPLCLREKSFPAPLARPSAIVPVIVPGFLVSKEWVGARARLQWLELEACAVQSPSRPGPHCLAKPHRSRPLSSLTGFGQPMDISRISTKGILRAALPTSEMA